MPSHTDELTGSVVPCTKEALAAARAHYAHANDNPPTMPGAWPLAQDFDRFAAERVAQLEDRLAHVEPYNAALLKGADVLRARIADLEGVLRSVLAAWDAPGDHPFDLLGTAVHSARLLLEKP